MRVLVARIISFKLIISLTGYLCYPSLPAYAEIAQARARGYSCRLTKKTTSFSQRNLKLLIAKKERQNASIELKISSIKKALDSATNKEKDLLLAQLNKAMLRQSTLQNELRELKNCRKQSTPKPTATSTPITSPIQTNVPTLSPTASATATATTTATPTSTSTPTATFTPTSTPNIPPAPELQAWESHMLTFGAQHGGWLILHQDDSDVNPPLAATYYDAARIFYQIADYTSDPVWNQYASAAAHVYRDRYVLPNNGAVPGYWNFTRGLRMHYARTGNAASKNAVILLSRNAAFASDTTPISSISSYALSREVSYAIQAYLDAEKLGEPRRPRLSTYVTIAKGHLDQWLAGADPIYAPFMYSLTADALIQYYTEVENDPEILDKIKKVADWTWNNYWVSNGGAFIYRVPETNPAPDLNLLIAPIYAWLYQQTGDKAYLNKADQIFQGGVLGAYLNGPKQFNQNYRVSFDYLRLRTLTW